MQLRTHIFIHIKQYAMQTIRHILN